MAVIKNIEINIQVGQVLARKINSGALSIYEPSKGYILIPAEDAKEFLLACLELFEKGE